MSRSNSETSSSTSTSTEQRDERVTATDQAVAVGGQGTLNVTDQFSDNVLTAFERLVTLASDAGLVATGFAKEAQKATETALQKVSERASESEARENANGVLLLRVATIGGIVGVLYIALNSKTPLNKIFSFKGKGR